MAIASGSIYHCFDESLRSLLLLLDRTLPDESACSNMGLIDWERQSYQAECEFVIKQMVERAQRLVEFRAKKPEMMLTDEFCFEKYSDICNLLDSATYRLTETGKSLVAELKHALGRLLNRNLTDEEYLVKWEKLKRKALMASTKTQTTRYTAIHEYCDETQPDEIALCRYVLTHNYPEEDVTCFMRARFRGGQISGTKMVEVEPPAATPAQKPKKRGGRKKQKGTLVTHGTFTYRWMEKDSKRIALLFQGLLQLKWIDDKTRADDFMSLFVGKECDVKIKWTGSQANLYYLFKLITENDYVTIPEGAGKWQIVDNHFVDESSHMFKGAWNKQHKPIKTQGSVEALVELLNAGKTELDMRRMFDTAV